MHLIKRFDDVKIMSSTIIQNNLFHLRALDKSVKELKCAHLADQISYKF